MKKSNSLRSVAILTLYSKIERSMFQKIVLDTLNCIPIIHTGADLNILISFVF